MDGYKHILVPLDGSQCSEHAVAEAKRLQGAFGAKITLLSVVSDPDFDCAMGNPPTTPASVRRETEEAEQYLAGLAGDIAGAMETKVVVGYVAKSILSECRDLGCDIIVMGSRGVGSRMRRFLVGSIAQEVLAKADVPVLIVS